MQDLCPIKRAAQRLGISIWTLRKKVYEGDIDSIKIGVKLLIPGSEIDRLIREGTRPRKTPRVEPDERQRTTTPEEVE
jgi:excisionase family DNA binding protein